MIRRIAITGSTGFVGAAVVAAIQRRFENVTLRLLVRPRADAAAVPTGSSIEIIQGDLRDDAIAHRFVEGADAVLHLASPPPKTEGVVLHEVNVRGARNLARAASKADVRVFVHMSTAAVYGAPHRGKDWAEDAPTIPYHDYGRTKLGGESGVTAGYLDLPDADPEASIVMEPTPQMLSKRALVVLRPTIVYGRDSNFLKGVAAQVRNSPTAWVTVGDEWVNPIFLKDLAEITATCIEKAKPGAIVINVGGPDRILMEDLRDKIAQWIGTVRRRHTLPSWLAPSITRWRARRELPAYRAVLLAKAQGQTFNSCVALDRLLLHFSPKLTPLEVGLSSSFVGGRMGDSPITE